MKKILISIIIVIFSLGIEVKANIICNDGKKSASCDDCHQGCCSGHGGCLKKENNNDDDNEDDYLKYVALGAGAAGAGGGAAYAGYRLGRKK